MIIEKPGHMFASWLSKALRPITIDISCPACGYETRAISPCPECGVQYKVHELHAASCHRLLGLMSKVCAFSAFLFPFAILGVLNFSPRIPWSSTRLILTAMVFVVTGAYGFICWFVMSFPIRLVSHPAVLGLGLMVLPFACLGAAMRSEVLFVLAIISAHIYAVHVLLISDRVIEMFQRSRRTSTMIGYLGAACCLSPLVLAISYLQAMVVAILWITVATLIPLRAIDDARRVVTARPV